MVFQLGKGQVHIAEEFVFLLLPVDQVVQAAAGPGEDAFPGHRPEGLIHEAEIIHEQLLAIDGDGPQPLLPAEMPDEELPAAPLVPIIGEDSHAVPIGDLHGVQDPLVGQNRIQPLLLFGQKLHEAHVSLVQAQGMSAKEKVDHPLVGGDHRGKGHRIPHLEMQHREKLLQAHGHVPVSPRDGKAFSIVKFRRRLNCGQRQPSVLVDDLEHPRIVGLGGGEDPAGQTEHRKGFVFQLPADLIKGQRDAYLRGGSGPGLDIVHHLLYAPGLPGRALPLCSCLPALVLFLQILAEQLQQRRVKALLPVFCSFRLFCFLRLFGSLALFPPHPELAKLLLAGVMGDLQIRVQHILVVPLPRGVDFLQALQIPVDRLVHAGEQILHIALIAVKRVAFLLSVKQCPSPPPSSLLLLPSSHPEDRALIEHAPPGIDPIPHHRPKGSRLLVHRFLARPGQIGISLFRLVPRRSPPFLPLLRILNQSVRHPHLSSFSPLEMPFLHGNAPLPLICPAHFPLSFFPNHAMINTVIDTAKARRHTL